ncbi:hypothetical protein [Erwinia sp. MYb535]|uniref:hypothetical protein n=1 Tax=Erwinia sp. MYb535 TaxID=2745309 RepID=UPI0030AC6E51
MKKKKGRLSDLSVMEWCGFCAAKKSAVKEILLTVSHLHSHASPGHFRNVRQHPGK